MTEVPAFTNGPVSAESLPDVSDVAFTPIDPRHALATVAAHAVYLVPLILAGAVTAAVIAGLAAKIGAATAAIGICLLTAHALLARPLCRAKGYALREHDVLWREGLIWRRETAVPFNRIQHVETAHGPLDRWLGLAEVKVFTAGAAAADIALLGLPASQADRLHRHLLARAGMPDDG